MPDDDKTLIQLLEDARVLTRPDPEDRSIAGAEAWEPPVRRALLTFEAKRRALVADRDLRDEARGGRLQALVRELQHQTAAIKAEAEEAAAAALSAEIGRLRAEQRDEGNGTHADETARLRRATEAATDLHLITSTREPGLIMSIVEQRIQSPDAETTTRILEVAEERLKALHGELRGAEKLQAERGFLGMARAKLEYSKSNPSRAARIRSLEERRAAAQLRAGSKLAMVERFVELGARRAMESFQKQAAERAAQSVSLAAKIQQRERQRAQRPTVR